MQDGPMLRKTSNNVPAAESKTTRSAAPLLNGFVKRCCLPFIQQNKRSWKVDRGNLQRHILPYLGAYRLSDIAVDTLPGHGLRLSAGAGLRTTCDRQLYRAATTDPQEARAAVSPGSYHKTAEPSAVNQL